MFVLLYAPNEAQERHPTRRVCLVGALLQPAHDAGAFVGPLVHYRRPTMTTAARGRSTSRARMLMGIRLSTVTCPVMPASSESR